MTLTKSSDDHELPHTHSSMNYPKAFNPFTSGSEDTEDEGLSDSGSMVNLLSHTEQYNPFYSGDEDDIPRQLRNKIEDKDYNPFSSSDEEETETRETKPEKFKYKRLAWVVTLFAIVLGSLLLLLFRSKVFSQMFIKDKVADTTEDDSESSEKDVILEIIKATTNE